MQVDDGLTTLEVRLVRFINSDGEMQFRITTPKNYNAVEVLGLLEAAKYSIYSDIRREGVMDDE